MSRFLFDIEANGLLHEVTKTWCLHIKDVDTMWSHSYHPTELNNGLSHLLTADVLIGHNIIGYDIPVIKKIHPDLVLPDPFPLIIDTLVISRALWPERPGGHGLGAWGERLGWPKGEHEDFTKFSINMMEYCERDVELNHLVFNALEEEHGAAFPGYKVY